MADMNPLLVLLAIAAVVGFGYIGGPVAAFAVAVIVLLGFIAERVFKHTQQTSRD